MGTLFDQPVRKGYAVTENEATSKFQQIKKFAVIHGISYDDSFKIFELLEYSRRTDLNTQDRNIHDEQMQGFGELIQDFIDKIDFIAKVLDDKL